MSKRQKGFMFILITSLLNGLIPSVTQRAFLTGLSVETVLTSRYLLASVLIWTFIFIAKKNYITDKNTRAYMIMLGILLFTCATVLNESYKYLPGAIIVIIEFTYVVIVVFVEILIGRVGIEKRRVIAMTLAISGLLLVVWPKEGVENLSTLGILFALMGAFFYAMQTIGMGSLRLEKVDAEVITGYMSLVIFLGNVLRCTISAQPYFPSHFNQWILIFILGAGAAFIAPLLFCMAVKTLGASDTALGNTTEPVFAYIAGILLMNDRISLNATLGGLFVLGSVVILNIKSRKKL